MREVRALVLAVLAACGGREGTVAEPRGGAAVRVVRCAPATPSPMISAAGLAVASLGSARELARVRLRGHAARKALAAPEPVELRMAIVIPGTVGRSDVMRDLSPVVPKLRTCLERNVTAVTEATTVTVSFDVDPEGNLTRIGTTGGEAELRACSADVFRALRIPAGNQGRVSAEINYDPAGLVKREPEEAPAEPSLDPWTPFALETGVPVDSAAQIARSLEVEVRRRSEALDRCFAASTATGSVRAMLELDREGRVVAARVGGLGVRTIETCLGDALVDVAAPLPTVDAVEVACDLSRGDASPWRATTDAGYQVIHASHTQVTHGSATLADGEASAGALPGGETYLVIVEPETPGLLIDRALTWAHEGDGTLIAMRAPSGPPVLLGAGRSIYGVVAGTAGAANGRQLTIVVGSKAVATCERTPRHRGVTRTTADATLSDPRAVSLLIGELAAGCRASACAGSLGIAIDKAASARDLLEVVSAARRHGFERVMIGSGGCASTSATDEADDD